MYQDYGLLDTDFLKRYGIKNDKGVKKASKEESEEGEKGEQFIMDYFTQMKIKKVKNENGVEVEIRDVRVKFKDSCKATLMAIFRKSFRTDLFFTIAEQDIINTFQEYFKGKDIKPNTWVDCLKTCKKHMRQHIYIETNSTAYLLKLFVNSIMHINSDVLELDIQVTGGIDNLTGKLTNDADKIMITGIENTGKQNRLIMGFGPSASGKTFLTLEIIKILSAVEDGQFPTIFVSVDGGIIRESSKIYRYIVDNILKLSIKKGEFTVNFNLSGILNLQAPAGPSLFETGSIKSNFLNYLKKYEKKISVYVPETLSGCITKPNATKCYKKIVKPFVDLTGDNKWIGLFIWQHIYGALCNKKYGYECKGTTQSGKEREKTEGKIYSNSAYVPTFKLGKYLLNMAPSYRLNIHNSGGKTHLDNNSEFPNKAILKDLTEYPDGINKLEEYFNTPTTEINDPRSRIVYCRKRTCGEYSKKIRLIKKLTRKLGLKSKTTKKHNTTNQPIETESMNSTNSTNGINSKRNISDI